MNGWILSVGAVVILTSVITMILPEGKTGKFIKGIFSLLVMLVILAPVIKYDGESFPWQTQSETEAAGNFQEIYKDYITAKRVESVKSGCEKILGELGIKGAKIEIYCDYLSDTQIKIKKVIINLENAVIISDKAHIDITDEAKRLIGNYVGIEEFCVEIYG